MPPSMQTPSLASKSLQNGRRRWWPNSQHNAARWLGLAGAFQTQTNLYLGILGWTWLGKPALAAREHATKTQSLYKDFCTKLMAPPPEPLKTDPVAVTGVSGHDSPSGNTAGTTSHQTLNEGLIQTLLPGDPVVCISTPGTLLEKFKYYPAQPPVSRFLSQDHCSPAERGIKFLLEHNESYLSTCSVSRSRGGRLRRGTVLHITMSSIKPGIVSKTDVLAPSHLLQPLTRLSDLV